MVTVPIFALFNIECQKRLDVGPFTEHLDNRVNPNMNNLAHVDHCIKDWTYDNDCAMMRYS